MTKVVGEYAAVGLVLLGLLAATLWPWLDAPGRRGIAAAAAVAWPVQVAAFGLLVRSREDQTKFLAVWAGGTVVRMAVIGIAAFALTRLTALAPAPTLLGLAGFFFVLLLLEPWFFRRSGGGTAARDHAGDGDTRDGGGGLARRGSGRDTAKGA